MAKITPSQRAALAKLKLACRKIRATYRPARNGQTVRGGRKGIVFTRG
jgi:hypothetical protein